MNSLAVLISVYTRDDANLFEDALISVFNQQLRSEYLVKIYLGIDGPIGPDLENIISRHSNKIHKIVRSNENQGLGSMLNMLIDSLSDELYVFRMDADDFSLPNRFQHQIDFLNRNPDIDIVGTDIIEWDRSTNKKRIISYAFDNKDALEKISQRVPVAHPSVCFRRHVFKIISHYPNINGNEDIALWFECLKSGLKISNVHEPLLQFTISKNFWSRRSFRKAISELICYTRGIYQLKGFTWQYIYPFARFIFRLMPRTIIMHCYNSKLRQPNID